MFYVKGNPQLNKESFTFSENSQYPYFTRTVFNNGIYDYADYLDKEHLIKGNSIAVGMMSCKFFYMQHDFYAGQFTKTCYPKFKRFNKTIAMYFISLMNRYSDKLKGVLVRDFEKTFSSITIDLPAYNDTIALDFIENYISEIEQENISDLDKFLKQQSLDDYELTIKEKQCIEIMQSNKVNYKEFKIVDIFDVKNTKSIMKSQIAFNSGLIPYVTAGESNNSIATYISANSNIIDTGNCIVIGGKSTVVTYQEHDFVSNDSHNLALYLKLKQFKNMYIYLYFVSLLNFRLKQIYNWNDSISSKKIQKDIVYLPVDNNNNIDYPLIETFIGAVQKLCIRPVIEWRQNQRKLLWFNLYIL